jgi:hypothetical protein
MNIYLSYPQPPLNNICIISKLSYLYFLIPSLISFSARTSLQLLSVPATAPACRSHLPGIFISRCIAFISLTARLLWCSLGLLFLVAHGTLPDFSSSLQSRGASPPSQLDLHLWRELFPGAARRFSCSAPPSRAARPRRPPRCLPQPRPPSGPACRAAMVLRSGAALSVQQSGAEVPNLLSAEALRSPSSVHARPISAGALIFSHPPWPASSPFFLQVSLSLAVDCVVHASISGCNICVYMCKIGAVIGEADEVLVRRFLGV